MPAFFIDREECFDDVLRPSSSTHDDEPTGIETVAFIAREFKDPKMTAAVARAVGIELPTEGEL